MESKNKVLFFFTKHYPFGFSEAYIDSELKFLSVNFDKIIIVPSEYFGDFDNTAHREIPANTELLNLNSNSIKPKKKKDILFLFKILVDEFIHEERKFRFLKNINRYWGILNHQYALAEKLALYLEKFPSSEKYFYSYWCHYSCILLGILKEKKIIRHFVSRAHSIDLYHNHWIYTAKGFLPYRHFKFKTLDRIFPVSKTGSNFLQKTYPSIASKVECKYLGVADNGINPTDFLKEFTVVSCSSLTPNKRIHLIAEILKHVTVKVKWMHFGDGPEMSFITKQAKHLPSHITIDLKGQVDNSAILTFYKNNSVNLFINVSEAEGIPVSLMEAISFGIPVMATDVYGNPEIANEKTGFTIPLNFEPNHIAKLISEFAADQEQQRKLKLSARNFYINSFNADMNYSAFAKQLQEYKG